MQKLGCDDLQALDGEFASPDKVSQPANSLLVISLFNLEVDADVLREAVADAQRRIVLESVFVKKLDDLFIRELLTASVLSFDWQCKESGKVEGKVRSEMRREIGGREDQADSQESRVDI